MWPTVILSGFLLIAGLLYILSHMPSNKYNYAWVRTFFSSISSSTKKPTDLTQAINQESSVFTRDELEKLFSTFDKNGDGFITKQELLESLKNMNILMSTKEVDEMVSKLDADGDGLIDFQEFCVLSESLLGQESGEPVEEEILKEAFDVFDKDKDGLISEMELGMLLRALGLKEGKQIEDCREMIRKVDDDGDGMVNFSEFKKMMKGGRKLGHAANT